VLVSTHYMDEAERCHRLAYIAWGSLLATGTAEEVVGAQGLTAWQVTGPDLWQLAEALRGLPGVDQVTPFGNTLHVIGRDARRLFESISQVRETSPHRWEEMSPGLEDVFISLMERAPDTPG
jgi:ABC-2 type transport system ATP-binding protein